jgi:ankyrin repeat protein
MLTIVAEAPQLPINVILKTPPLSPVQPCIQSLIIQTHGALQDHSVLSPLSGQLPNTYNVNLVQPNSVTFDAFGYIFGDLKQEGFDNLDPSRFQGEAVLDRQTLLKGCSWIRFQNGFSKMLNGNLGHRSFPLNEISDSQPKKIQTANSILISQLPSSLIPRKAQAAQIFFSLVSNNHSSLNTCLKLPELRSWIREISKPELAYLVKGKDPTTIAVIDWLLEWILRNCDDDLFFRILDAGLDKQQYFAGTHGGRLLLRTVGIATPAMILAILDESPDLYVTDKHDDTILRIAASNAHHTTLQVLFDHGADFRYEESRILYQTYASNNLENLAWLLDKGADPKHLDENFGAREIYEDFPTLEMCEVLWRRFPARWDKATACLLVYSAALGLDELKKRVDQIKDFYIDLKSVLEEAFCFAMEKLAFPYENFFHHFLHGYPNLHSDKHWNALDNLRKRVLVTFLCYGINPNAASLSIYPRPIVSAIKYWDVEDIATLLDYGANMTISDVMRGMFHSSEGVSQPYRCKANRCENLKYLVLKRNIALEMNLPLPNGQYALHLACEVHHGDQEDMELVRCFVENGSDINGTLRRDENYTALHLAVRHGRLSVVRYLIEKGANVKGWPKRPSKTLYELCVKRCPSECQRRARGEEQRERQAIFKLLLQHNAESMDGVSIPRIDLGGCLIHAMWDFSNSSLVDTIMDSGMSLRGSVELQRAYEQLGPFSPLQFATMTRIQHFNIAKRLIEHGADVNQPAGENDCGTAFQLACSMNSDYGPITPVNFQLIDLLLQNGAEVNSPPARTRGRTALQFACANRATSFKLINLLLDKGADINALAAHNKGITALQGAAIKGDLELVLFLLERGARVDAPGAVIEGRTALEGAAEMGRLDIVDVLLNAHLMIGLVPNVGIALELAEDQGHFGVVKLLKSWSTPRA